MGNTTADGGVRHAATVKSADRVLHLLEYLGATGGASFGTIMADLGLPNSSGHQLLQTALARGFVEFDDRTRDFRLGMRLWEVAQAYTPAYDLIALAQPLMDDLAALTKETVQLARLDHLDSIYLAVAESPFPIRLVSRVGARVPAHATGIGKVLLAGLDPDELQRRLSGATLQRFTSHTLTDHAELARELERVRERGYGEDYDEYTIGCRCTARPVRDPSGQIVAAMSVSVVTPRFNQALARRISAGLVDAIAALEEQVAASR